MSRAIRELYHRKKGLALLLTSGCAFLFFWFVLYVLRYFSPNENIDSQINTTFLFTLIIAGSFYLVLLGFRIRVDLLYAIILGLVLAYLSTSLMLLNVDRSRSFYVLSWINEYEFPTLEDQRTYRMVRSNEILAVIPINERITEQVHRGFVTSQGGKLVLTFKGRSALSIAELLARNFQLEGWYKNKY